MLDFNKVSARKSLDKISRISTHDNRFNYFNSNMIKSFSNNKHVTSDYSMDKISKRKALFEQKDTPYVMTNRDIN